MRTLFFLLLGYFWLIGAAVAFGAGNWSLAFAFVALAWCNKLEGER